MAVGAVLTGFATIAAVIALGALLAHIRLVDVQAQILLSRLAFFVASPALMVTTIGDADVGQVLSRNLVATTASVVVSAAIYLAGARWVWRRAVPESVIGALSSAYVNAGNLGIPIAAYVLGDAALVAPTLLLQLLVLQPLALAVLDRHTRAAPAGAGAALRQVASNPLTLGSVLGLVLALTGCRLPEVVAAPVTLVGDMAVPSMLLAYGIALRLGPGLGAGGPVAELATTTTLKLLVQPFVAWVVAHWLLGVDGTALLAVVVTAALPTAQNIFVHATRFGRGQELARDTILLTTMGSVPVILLITLLLG
ncbi:AEC family transporter [Janibacter anophelis]|uniref:AEC family transporter n=1 Tax=Janibacter anophelis TaxID=319054 RepID=UPI003F819B2F